VTNKPREFTVPLLERLGMTKAFTVVVAGDDVAHPKPHPALLLAACERLGVLPGEALMIGDSLNDAQAAQAAGMKAVLVETGYNEGESLDSLRHDPTVLAVVSGLLDAARWVLRERDDHIVPVHRSKKLSGANAEDSVEDRP
jgi:phosphoglycolate phosphatase